MKKVRYAITGFGRFAEKAIAPAIRQSHNAELAAIQNRTRAKAERAAAELSVPFASDSVSEIVARPDVDALFIVSANAAHCAETLLAAEAGKHVLVEKPMAMNVAECQRMIDACTRNNVKLMVGHMVRLSPLVKRMRELVQSGAIGRVVRAESNFVYDGRLSSRAWLLDTKVAGGGPTFDVGVHCLDTLRFILDDEVVSVKAEMNPAPDEKQTEATSQLLLRFSHGAIATIMSSYDSPLRESRIEVLGTEARISALDFTVGDRRCELKIEKRSQTRVPEVTMVMFEVPNLYVEEVTAFSACILENKEPVLSADDALKNQRVLDRAMNLPTSVG
jgi:predicted dehydrogenase